MLADIIDLQNNAVNHLISLIKSTDKETLTFRAPTGSGKTYMMADFINRMLTEDSDIVFLVSSLSKSDLAKQNYDKFCEYRDHHNFIQLNPYLINSDISGEERLHIPDDYNVYLLPRDLYKESSRLMQGSMLAFLNELKFSKLKRIVWIKDECHIATKNLDALSPIYFEHTINFSATPKLSRGQHPDVEITDSEAERCKLIKSVTWGEDSDDFETALMKLIEIKANYINMLNVKPCLIVQISNKDKADDELNGSIMPVLEKYPDLKWMLIVNDPKECNTNDVFKAKKLPVLRWKDYAKGNLSEIDVIIFKLVISEGWDIPRACMLYQARNSRSKQLDEQVVGRVKRNPRLVDYESLPDEAKKLATTAWVWGVHNDGNKVYGVKLYEDQSEIINNIRVKTTRIKPLERKEEFSIETFLADTDPKAVHTSIFELQRRIKATDYSVRRIVYGYTDTYTKWWNVAEHIDEIAKASNQYMCDYSQSMEVNSEESFSPSSFYNATDKYVNISNWVWHRRDGAEKFSFDSVAERDWAEVLKDLSTNNIASVTTGKKNKNVNAGIENLYGEVEEDYVINKKEVFLWGKNYVPESTIKFEYYLGSLHSSYPDFIMKDKYGRIHIFEVKSVNKSSSFNIDGDSYVAKVNELKKCYKQASVVTGQLFYLPILKEDIWQIVLYTNGDEYSISIDQFRNFIATGKLL